MCDCLVLADDQQVVNPSDLPNKHLLKPHELLLRKPRITANFVGYPHDPEHLLDGLVLERHGFSENPPLGMRVCDECYSSLKKCKMPEAALANGFYVGELPDHLRGATRVEKAAAFPVRVKGHVVALRSRKMKGVTGSAQRCLRGTSVFYASLSISVARTLPLAASGLLDMITVVLVGKTKPTRAQLKRYLGARKPMIRAWVDHLIDRERTLIVGYPSTEDVQISNEALDTYHADGRVPEELFNSALSPEDAANCTETAKSSYTNARREEDDLYLSDKDDDESGDKEGLDADAADAENEHAAYNIDSYAVMESGEDAVTSEKTRPESLRKLADDMRKKSGQDTSTRSDDPGGSLKDLAVAQARLLRGEPPVGGTRNAVVVPHGDILGDFHNNSAWTGGFADLFPEGAGGPECPTRQRAAKLPRYGQIMLNRRLPHWREDRVFIFVLAAIIFRHEAMSNVQFKLRNKMSSATAATLASITRDDVLAMAAELQLGKSTTSALRDRPNIRTLLNTMRSISTNATWSDAGKHGTRMEALSLFLQIGFPSFWLTTNPCDVSSPMVMNYAGHSVDLTSACYHQMPDFPSRAQTVARDPVATATFFHRAIDTLFKHVLRIGATDSDGGCLGKIQASDATVAFRFYCRNVPAANG